MYSFLFTSPAYHEAIFLVCYPILLVDSCISLNCVSSLSLRFAVAWSLSTKRTLMEAVAPSSSALCQQQQDHDENNSNNNTATPFAGQTFYPQDIIYNADVSKALLKLSQLKRKDHLHLTNSDKKKLEALLSCGNQEVATLTLIGHKGESSEYQMNQDRAVVISPFHIGQDNKQQQEDAASTTIPSRLMAVFDGHSKNGEKISQYAATQLPMVLAMKLDQIQRTDHDENEETNLVKNALIDTFIEIDRTCPGQEGGGCTASVVLQRGSKLYAANAGDSCSFVVLYQPSSPNKTRIIYETRADTPGLPDERRRVKECGGDVVYQGYEDYVVLYTEPVSRTLTALAMSRSIGDWEAGKVGVIPDPIVDVIDIDQVVERWKGWNPSGSDDVHIFVVSATDGMTKFFCPEYIAKTLASSLYDDDAPYLLSAIKNHIDRAKYEWNFRRRNKYRDDVTVSVMDIRRPPAAPSK
jgi:serine/threonine protein phosphatase PrpC